MVLVRAVAALLLMIALPSLARGEKHVALVIANGAYVKVPKLENPKNDAAAMEAMFKAAGFATVVRVNDLGAATMRRALRDFSDTAYEADIAVIFYAGHGMEVSGINYLIPTDAILERDIDVQDEAISLDRVTQILERAKRLRFIILDACRDNPFVRSMRRTIATRSVRSGYGEIDEKSLPPNTLVAYAQRAGATAEDGTEANSPYTAALLKHLPTPGLDVELALRRVRDDVLKATRNRQEPFKYGSLGGAEVALVATKTPQPVPEAKGPARLSEAAEAWDRAKDTTDPAVLEAFIARFKDTFYADLARSRANALRGGQVAAPSPSTPFPKQPVAIVAPAPRDVASSDITIPTNTFYKGQTTTQAIQSAGPLMGIPVRDADGLDLGTVAGLIFENGETVGLIFNHLGKPVGIRLKSANVSIDTSRGLHSVKLAIRNASEVLATLEPYQRLAQPSR